MSSCSKHSLYLTVCDKAIVLCRTYAGNGAVRRKSEGKHFLSHFPEIPPLQPYSLGDRGEAHADTLYNRGSTHYNRGSTHYNRGSTHYNRGSTSSAHLLEELWRVSWDSWLPISPPLGGAALGSPLEVAALGSPLGVAALGSPAGGRTSSPSGTYST